MFYKRIQLPKNKGINSGQQPEDRELLISVGTPTAKVEASLGFKKRTLHLHPLLEDSLSQIEVKLRSQMTCTKRLCLSPGHGPL